MRFKHLWVVGFATAASGCGAGSGTGGATPAPAPVDRVMVTNQVGGMGVTELHDDRGVAAHRVAFAPGAVWRVLPGVYEQLGVPDHGAAPDELLYGSRNFRARRIEGDRLSAFLDCGMGPTATPRADEYDVRMTVVSQVRDAGDGESLIETTVEASARPRGNSGNAVDCASRGTLESRVATLATLALTSGPGGR